MSNSLIPGYTQLILAYTGLSLVDTNMCVVSDKVPEERDQRSVCALANGACTLIILGLDLPVLVPDDLAGRILRYSHEVLEHIFGQGSITFPKPEVVKYSFTSAFSTLSVSGHEHASSLSLCNAFATAKR